MVLRFRSTALLALLGCLTSLPLMAQPQPPSPRLETSPSRTLELVLRSSHRQQSAARDFYRHPKETLTFFELEPHHHVVEIWPGAAGWYTEILGPYLKDQGQLYAAHFDPNSPVQFFRTSRASFIEKLESNHQAYQGTLVTTFSPTQWSAIAPAGMADRVLTFRNVHNWYMRGGGDQQVLAAFKQFYQALKPGGILGVVEHRLPDDRPLSDQADSGYMKQDYVIAQAVEAGFVFVASSDINANPKDNTNHSEGVWSLPPSLREGENNREKYLAIGESDRMTLKFVKPGGN